jgi:hypothetical protein
MTSSWSLAFPPVLHGPARHQGVRTVVTILALSASLKVVPNLAQTAPDRATVEQLRRELGEASTVEQVHALGPPPEADPSPAVILLWRGFAAVRLGELTRDRRYFDDAIRQFDDATLRAPDWPYPWFGLAVAKDALHHRDALAKSSRYQPDGMSYFEGFTRAISRVFERDSLFGPGIEFLRRRLVGQGERQQPEVLLAPLRRVAAGPGGSPEDALILARDYRRRGRGDSALVMLDLYRERGGNAGMARLERAHALASLGAFDAAATAYLAGLQHLSRDARDAYRNDLLWIADAAELSAFDREPQDSLAGWVADFWRWRDDAELRRPGERLREHLRRWAFVDLHYRVVSPERRTQFARTWATPVGPCNRGDYYLADDLLGDSVVRSADGRRRERLYDDRAYVYMRHGEPARRTGGKGAYQVPGSTPPTQPPQVDGGVSSGEAPQSRHDLLLQERMENARANESWLYWFGGARRLFHFEGTPFLGLGAPTTLTVDPLPDTAWLELRGSLDPSYYGLAHLIGPRFACERLVQRAVSRTRADAAVALRSDSYTLLFRHEIHPVVQVYAVGRPDLDAGRILVVFALPGEQLVPEVREPGRPEGVLYPVETRVSAIDSVRRVSRALDSVRQFLTPDSLGRGSHLTGYVELAVPPGSYRVGTALFQPGPDVGGAVLRDGIDLRLPPSGLYLSDLLLGREGSGLGWNYRGERIPLNPLGAFSRSESAAVFYEVSGLRPGRSYVTSMELIPVKGRPGGESIRLRFTQIADRDELTVRRTLGLARLGRGQYQLSVEVIEEGSGRKIRRQQLLTIRD